MRIAVIASILMLLLFGCSSDRESNGDMVSTPETAIAIARAVLNERFGDNLFDDRDFVVETSGRVWVVRYVMDNPVTLNDDGTLTVTLGWNYLVRIRKSDGAILQVESG